MHHYPLPRIDKDDKLRDLLLPYSRFNQGDIWIDPLGKHKIGCLDACNKKDILRLFDDEKAIAAIDDPPYNFIAFQEQNLTEFIEWCKLWIDNTIDILNEDSSFYIWLGADQNNFFEPLPSFMQMMKSTCLSSRSFITMRNQRGYGTQKNWMAIRQELLYYIKGKAKFNIEAEYTEIPKTLKGYYKIIDGVKTENFERSKSSNIRAGNVWFDIQQVFYRMEENVNGCYAQKPLKSIERIIKACSDSEEIITDFFSHSGTTLIASEILNRRCFTIDLDPIYCEISLRRLENLRTNSKTGWQDSNPFFEEILSNKKLRNHLSTNYNIDYSDKQTLYTNK